MRRIAITGFGAITAIGATAAATFDSALAARSGARRAPELAVDAVVPIDASAPFDPSSVRLRQRAAPMDRATAMAVAVARQAIDDTGADFESDSPARVCIGAPAWGPRAPSRQAIAACSGTTSGA